MHGRLARWRKWRACDVGEAKEGLENELWRRWSNGRIGDWAVTQVKRRKGWRTSCDVGEVTERFENEQSSFSNLSLTSPTSQLILQHFRRFTYVTAHSPTLPLLHLRHRSFSKPFFRFSYVTSSSFKSPGEAPMLRRKYWPIWDSNSVARVISSNPIPVLILNCMSSAHSPTFPSLHLRHNSFSNTSVSSPTSQLILKPFPRLTYVTTLSPTLPLLHLCHNSFSNPSLAWPTSQLILQPFCCLTYVTAHSPTLLSFYLCHSSFSNPSVILSMSQLILQPFCCFTYVTGHSPTLLLLLLCHRLFTHVTWRAAHGLHL